MALSRRALVLALLTFLAILATPSLAHAAGVQPRFDLSPEPLLESCAHERAPSPTRCGLVGLTSSIDAITLSTKP